MYVNAAVLVIGGIFAVVGFITTCCLMPNVIGNIIEAVFD